MLSCFWIGLLSYFVAFYFVQCNAHAVWFLIFSVLSCLVNKLLILTKLSNKNFLIFFFRNIFSLIRIANNFVWTLHIVSVNSQNIPFTAKHKWVFFAIQLLNVRFFYWMLYRYGFFFALVWKSVFLKLHFKKLLYAIRFEFVRLISFW